MVNKVRILQLVDDEKFTDCIISIFDSFEEKSNSDYVVFYEKELTGLRLVKSSGRVEQIVRDSPEWQQLKEDAYDIVWVHSLTQIKGDFVNAMNNSARVVWSTFGWDYLRFLELPLLRHKSLINEFLRWSLRAKTSWVIKRLLSFWHLDFLFRPKWANQFIKRVDFYSCVLEEEWPLIQRVLSKKSKPFKFHYIRTNETTVTEDLKCDLERKEIWVGNSATATNNFYDILPLLTDYNQWQISAPLSYGNLIKEINEYGKNLFGCRWNGIIDFVPIHEFEKRMSSCSVFIFGHRRQQALGNINIALRYGGCVFLDKKSPAYLHFVANGIKVYTIDDLQENMLQCVDDFHELQGQNIEKMKKLRARYRCEVLEAIEVLIKLDGT